MSQNDNEKRGAYTGMAEGVCVIGQQVDLMLLHMLPTGSPGW
jgi:hypothetical protein